MAFSAETTLCQRHRWSKNGFCTRPGCRAERVAGAPLGELESMHTTYARPLIPNSRRSLSDQRRDEITEAMKLLLSTAEVAKLLGVKAGSVQGFARSGRILKVRVGGTDARPAIGYEPHSVNAARNGLKRRTS